MKAIEIFYSPVVNVRKMEDGDGDGGSGGDGLGVISGNTHGYLWVSIFHLEIF